MPKYYEGEAVVKAFTETTNQSATWARGVLASMEDADVAPVRNAHWERLDFPKRKRDYYRCTNCGRVCSRDYDDEQSISEMLPYCNCGAKMDEKKENVK